MSGSCGGEGSALKGLRVRASDATLMRVSGGRLLTLFLSHAPCDARVTAVACASASVSKSKLIEWRLTVLSRSAAALLTIGN